MYKHRGGFPEGQSLIPGLWVTGHHQRCSRTKNITGTLWRKPAAGENIFLTCTLLQVSF